MAPRREFPEDKFAPSSMKRVGDPADGMFDVDSPTGLPVGQAFSVATGMTLNRAARFVKDVEDGKIDPTSDEGMRETLNLALLTLGRGAPTARPGGIAPTAPPRYTVNPATDYRQTVNADYGIKPRVPYDNKPVIDQTFVPREQVRTVNEVRGQPTSSQRLNAESPRADVQLGNRQTAARNELSWQNLMDEMRASGEGMPERLARADMPKIGTSPAVQLAQAKVAGRTLTPAEVGGSESPFLTRPAPGIKRQAPAPEAPPVETALRARETQMAPAEYPVRSQFGVSEPGMMSFQDLQRARGAFAGPEVPPVVAQRQRIASQISAEETRRLAEQQLMAQRQRLAGAIDEASMARPTEGGPLLPPSRGNPTIGAVGPIGAGAAVTALNLGSQSVQEDRARQAAMERQRIDDLDAAGGAEYRSATQQPFAGTDFFAPASQRSVPAGYTVDDQSAAGLPDLSGYSLERAVPAAGSRSPAGIGSDYVNTARQIAAAKAQAPVGGKPTSGQRAPIDITSGTAKPQSGGFLSGLFTNQPATTRELFQRSVDNPDDAGAWMRAERQYAATHPKEGERNFDVTKLNESGMARGGAANASPTKEALLHKSLEIIHHMIRSR